jgi:ribose transport system substrate-binding protein
MLSVGAALLAGLAPHAVRAAPADEEYYMITFMSGLEYWKSCYAGFQDAAKIYGVKTAYTGAQQFDINQQVTVLEQVAAKRPAGITITVVNAEALVKPINKVIDSGIPVIIFDSDSPNSKRPSIVQTGNERAGRSAADALAAKVGEAGNVAVLVVPGTPTLEARAAGFKAQIAEKYPKMKVVATGN